MSLDPELPIIITAETDPDSESLEAKRALGLFASGEMPVVTTETPRRKVTISTDPGTTGFDPSRHPDRLGLKARVGDGSVDPNARTTRLLAGSIGELAKVTVSKVTRRI